MEGRVDIDISKARAIDGFMFDEELLWLASRAAKSRRIVEVGSYMGRSTTALAEHTEGIVYAVDDWRGIYNEFSRADELYLKFIGNVAGYIEAGKVVPVRVDHDKADPTEIIESADMVFIDGDHVPEAVARDIRKWLPIISDGGIISGHDFYWPGLAETVWSELGEVEIAPQTSIWWKIVRERDRSLHSGHGHRPSACGAVKP